MVLNDEIDYKSFSHRFTYDPVTGNLYYNNPVHKGLKGKVAGSRHSQGYWQVNLGHWTYLAHRVAWLLTHKEWPKSDLDHIDGDRQNNKLSNLRLCNSTTNAQNLKSRTGSSKYKGVHKVKGKPTNPYQTYIQILGKRKHIGYFSCEVEAAKAYDAYAKEHFGEYARLNIPEDS